MLFTGLQPLPLVVKAADTALYDNVLKPFWPELQELPKRLLDVRSVTDLRAVYLSHNPFIEAFAISIALGAIVLVVAEVNRNYSQIDRLWSILPNLYNAHFCLWAHLSGLPARRLDLVVVATTIWSIRLTFNYWRRGGYQAGSEDYRWAIIKKNIGQVGFYLLAWTFISFGQSILLATVTAPTYILLNSLQTMSPTASVDSTDYVFMQIIIGLVILEFVADQHQWDYHKAKHEYQKSAKVPSQYGFSREDLDRGFLANGLFAMVRHPNYTCEMSIWLTLYAWGCHVSGTYVNWTLIPALSYVFIFLGSTPITEKISSDKYEEYKEYQKQVGVFLPTQFLFFQGGYKGKKAGAQKKKQ